LILIANFAAKSNFKFYLYCVRSTSMLDIKEYFCPNDRCKHYGLRGEGNLMKAGTYQRKYSGEKKQMLKCRVCGCRFSETQSTIFAGCHYGEQTIRSIIVCISEGNGIRATARIQGLSKDRVNKIVLKAGQYAEKMLSNLLQSLHLSECQMDELWSFACTLRSTRVNKKNIRR